MGLVSELIYPSSYEDSFALRTSFRFHYERYWCFALTTEVLELMEVVGKHPGHREEFKVIWVHFVETF